MQYVIQRLHKINQLLCRPKLKVEKFIPIFYIVNIGLILCFLLAHFSSFILPLSSCSRLRRLESLHPYFFSIGLGPIQHITILCVIVHEIL